MGREFMLKNLFEDDGIIVNLMACQVKKEHEGHRISRTGGIVDLRISEHLQKVKIKRLRIPEGEQHRRNGEKEGSEWGLPILHLIDFILNSLDGNRISACEDASTKRESQGGHVLDLLEVIWV